MKPFCVWNIFLKIKKGNSSLNIKNQENNNYIFGRNSVTEALKSERNIESILISSAEITGSLKAIVSKAKEKRIILKRVNKKVLDSLSGNSNHQGVIAIVGRKETCTIKDILDLAKSKNEPPFIIIADGIEDPHNLGAIIRTAECCGVHGILIPKRRCAGLNATVEKTSAGALEHMLIAKVGNIASAIEDLKKLGVWVYAADMKGENWTSQDLTGPVALVIGSEGFGVGKLVREKCDFVLSLPIKGKVNSLNASVAAGILMYEVRRQRG